MRRITRGSSGRLPGEGTSSHLNLEELMHHAGVKMVHVPYAGWAQSSVSLLGGHIEAVVAQPGELKPMVDGARCARW